MSGAAMFGKATLKDIQKMKVTIFLLAADKFA